MTAAAVLRHNRGSYKTDERNVMSRQIGHFRFPDEADDSLTGVGDQRADVESPRPTHSPELEAVTPTDVDKREFANTYAALACLGGALLAVTLSFAPYYGTTQRAQSIRDACGRLHSTDLQRCIEENSQQQEYVSGLHWNAWGSWISWPAIVLFLIVAAVVAFKAVFGKSEKVVLSRQVRLALVLADLLFLVSFFHIPHDNAGRAWGLWLSLIVVIAINIGVLLATTEVGEWIAEHWPERAKKTTATPQPRSNEPQQTDYRPSPLAMPPGPRQPNWPPPLGHQLPGQQQPGQQQPSQQLPGQQPGLRQFPTSGQPQFPPSEQR